MKRATIKNAGKNSGGKLRAGFSDPAVEAVFKAYPSALRLKLLALRRLILDTARNTPEVGPLEETLKWGQPSYLTSQTKIGSTIRIDRVKPGDREYAIYFHCQTDLVETFREIYPELSYGGNRSIFLSKDEEMPEAALRHCIGLALTYHLSKRRLRLTRKKG